MAGYYIEGMNGGCHIMYFANDQLAYGFVKYIDKKYSDINIPRTIQIMDNDYSEPWRVMFDLTKFKSSDNICVDAEELWLDIKEAFEAGFNCGKIKL